VEEIVVEVLVRGGGEGTARRKGVERSLEGWSETRGGPSELSDLESLKIIWDRKYSGRTVGEVIDRLHNVSKTEYFTYRIIQIRRRTYLSTLTLPCHNNNPELKFPFPMHMKAQYSGTRKSSSYTHSLLTGNPSGTQKDTPASTGAILYDPDSADDIDDDDPDEDLDI
jgi:elongator complex protein 5